MLGQFAERDQHMGYVVGATRMELEALSELSLAVESLKKLEFVRSLAFVLVCHSRFSKDVMHIFTGEVVEETRSLLHVLDTFVKAPVLKLMHLHISRVLINVLCCRIPPLLLRRLVKPYMASLRQCLTGATETDSVHVTARFSTQERLSVAMALDCQSWQAILEHFFLHPLDPAPKLSFRTESY